MLDRIVELEVAAIKAAPVEAGFEPYTYEEYIFTSQEDLKTKLGEHLDNINVGQIMDI